MDVRPRLAVRPDLDQGSVKGPVLATDAREAVEVTRVAGVEDAPARAGENPRAPERLVAGERAAGEVPGRGEREPKPRDALALAPVQLDDAVPGDSPPLEVGTDAERHEERRPLAAGKLADGGHVQVV